MTVYQWLCLLGIPALIAGVFKYLHTLIKRNADDNKALKLGVQALLRSQMISDFNKCTEKGFAPIYARESFENSWSCPRKPRMNEPCKEETEKGIFQSPVGMCRGRHAGCDGLHSCYRLENRGHFAPCISDPGHIC